MLLIPLIKRLEDDYGLGDFGSSRSHGTPHQGQDYKTTFEQPLYAPENGVFIREKKPYGDGGSYDTGLLFKTDSGLEYTIFYVMPYNVLDGDTFKKGQVIGLAQDISSKFSGNMTNHAHVEIRKNGVLLDPNTILKKKA